MNIRALSLAGLATLWLGASAEKIDVTSFRYQGPFVVNHPVMVDSVDVNSKNLTAPRCLRPPFHSKQPQTAGKSQAMLCLAQIAMQSIC